MTKDILMLYFYMLMHFYSILEAVGKPVNELWQTVNMLFSAGIDRFYHEQYEYSYVLGK